jgi:hypothetical protein
MDRPASGQRRQLPNRGLLGGHRQGRHQAKGNLKQAGEKVKDAFKD